MNPRKSIVATVHSLQEELDLVDVWRVKNSMEKSFTWSQNSPRIFCRLDYWLISNTLHDLVKTTDIIPAIRTDHAAIFLELANGSNDNKGPGFWKMNCFFLDDEEYVNDIAEKIPVWLAEGRNELSDSRSIWDWMKYNIRVHTIQFSKRKARERNEREKVFKNTTLKQNIVLNQNPTT